MKTAHKILQTKTYSAFVHHENQQPMSALHVKRLAESMRDIGFLPSKPVQVYRRKDGKYVVIDGHHRLAAAKTLGIDVLFVIEPPANAPLIGKENVLVRKWIPESFARLFASQGNEDYVTLLFYVDRGIPLKQAASILFGESAHSGNVQARVCNGTFKAKELRYANQIIAIMDTVQDVAPNIKKRYYIEALSMLLFVPQFDSDLMIKKILAHPMAVQRCADRIQALEVLDDIYNFRNREKTNISFLAREVMRKRNKAPRQ